MTLQNFTILHAQPDSDVVMVHAYDGPQLVITFIPVIHLDDYFRRDHLTGRQANLVAESNKEALARIISAKYERREWTNYNRMGSTLRRVDLTLVDLDCSGEKLSDSVVATADQSGWMRPDGTIMPA